jgi:colanic acid/amylovoran biosynthesis glycosyltransferase
MTTRIAYFVTRFPKTSETFVVDELLALEQAGVEVALHALASGRGGPVDPDVAALDRRCRRLSLLSPRLLGAQLQWLVRAPIRLLGIWLKVVVQHAGSPRAGARAVVALVQAVAHASALQRSQVQHVHAHFATHTALAAWVVHRLTGLSYSFTAHADDIFVPRPMLEEKIRDAAFVVTISRFNRDYLRDRFAAARATPIEVVPCGVATERFQKVPAPAAGQPFTLACVARLERKKGHTHLLDACATLVARGVDLRCRLLGDGAERASLERQARGLGLGDRVEFLGAGDRDRVREVIAGAHIFVLPSVVDESGRADGVPVALMEAMAMGRPVVSTRVTGIPELIEDGVGGLLVPPHDADALADAIERVHLEAGLADRLAEAGRRRVLEGYELHRNVARLRELFARHAGGMPEHAAVCPPVRSATTEELSR